MTLKWTHWLVEKTWPVLLLGMVIVFPFMVKKTWDEHRKGE